MTTTPPPDTTMSIPDLMHAIHAIHPGCSVELALCNDGYAAVTVSGMPADLFPEPTSEEDSGGRYSYPNCYYASGGYLSVSRYADADFVAALRTALELISERVAVTR